MFDSKFLDDLAQKLAAAVPPGLQTLQQDIEKNFRAILQANLQKLDLVTRQEFEVQTALLARTREKLEILEQKLAEIEQASGITSINSTSSEKL